MSKIPTVDGIPVPPISLSSPSEPTEDDKKPLETAKDAVGSSPPSRFWLRMSAGWWRRLQYVGMSLHFLASPRPPSPSFSKKVPATISKEKGHFEIQVYVPEGYKKAKNNGQKFPAVVNFHGGGFTIGSATDDARFGRFILEHCKAIYVCVEYRLSPEFPFPVAVEDGADALLYIINHADELAIDPLKLATSGFSAGGNIALTSTILLNDHLKKSPKTAPKHKIRAVATWYPICDYTESREVKRARSTRPDQTLPANLTSLFDASYLYPPTLSLDSAYLSPSKATDQQLAEGIPETVIFYTCEWDMLQYEGEELAKRLGRAPINKDVRHKMIPEVPHAWDKSPDPTKPAAGSEEVYAECCKLLNEAFGKA
ncbi:putative esterases and lipase [Podospora australis]|uniref:Esterases and lipase n=1 Tax=Podospora australis TaxID=1536484 RepID=A0AAN6WLI5_9PEZI|nr:putative esterases and lipase [Podospora australis]